MIRRLIPTASLVLLLATTACSSSSSTSSSTSTSSTTRPGPTVTTAAPPAAQYVTIDGKKIRVPTELKTYPINPNSDHGQQVIIESRSFVPALLYANSGDIVFTNLTTTPQQLTFVNWPSPKTPLVTPEIAPGSTYSFHHVGTLALKVTGSNGSFVYLNIATIPGL
jgi:hypothetical protein